MAVDRVTQGTGEIRVNPAFECNCKTILVLKRFDSRALLARSSAARSYQSAKLCLPFLSQVIRDHRSIQMLQKAFS